MTTQGRPTTGTHGALVENQQHRINSAALATFTVGLGRNLAGHVYIEQEVYDGNDIATFIMSPLPQIMLKCIPGGHAGEALMIQLMYNFL